MEYEEGDINDLLNQNYVDGGWEPFSTNEWVAGDDSYLSRLYNNGEVFDDAEIGKIRLRPWQLFVDKEHFKDALRDYCIQEGFALVVNKANNLRYTVVYADKGANGEYMLLCLWMGIPRQ
ncbi:Serine/threonine-protein kinase STE7-like protein [Bienertia sinuspersici]